MNKWGGREDDEHWPGRNISGRQELEVRLGNEHISFEVTACIFLISTFVEEMGKEWRERRVFFSMQEKEFFHLFLASSTHPSSPFIFEMGNDLDG